MLIFTTVHICVELILIAVFSYMCGPLNGAHFTRNVNHMSSPLMTLICTRKVSNNSILVALLYSCTLQSVKNWKCKNQKCKNFFCLKLPNFIEKINQKFLHFWFLHLIFYTLQSVWVKQRYHCYWIPLGGKHL